MEAGTELSDPYSSDSTIWKTFLDEIQSSFNILPEASVDKQQNFSKYTPLLIRQRDVKYEERVVALGGTKKDRLDRHMEFQAMDRDSSEFFEKMRKEGTK